MNSFNSFGLYLDIPYRLSKSLYKLKNSSLRDSSHSPKVFHFLSWSIVTSSLEGISTVTYLPSDISIIGASVNSPGVYEPYLYGTFTTSPTLNSISSFIDSFLAIALALSSISFLLFSMLSASFSSLSV